MTRATETSLKVQISFFALYRERAGRSRMPLELAPGATVSDMVAEIRRVFPDLAPPTVNIVVAVNAEYAEPDTVLRDGDDIALIPPVSGGQDMVLITPDTLVPEEITARVRKDSNGAVVTFLGTTRDHADGKTVVRLEYDGHHPGPRGRQDRRPASR